jgi:hypothetical protein
MKRKLITVALLTGGLLIPAGVANAGNSYGNCGVNASSGEGPVSGGAGNGYGGHVDEAKGSSCKPVKDKDQGGVVDETAPTT